jgi:hypothetical protein
MNFEPLCKLHNCERRGVIPYPACLPYGIGNKPVLCPIVRLVLFWVTTQAFHIPQAKVVSELLAPCATQVAANMGKLMKQAEPEIIDAVVTHRKANNRRAISQLQSCSVQIRMWEMFQANYTNAVLDQKFNSQLRTFGRPT